MQDGYGRVSSVSDVRVRQTGHDIDFVDGVRDELAMRLPFRWFLVRGWFLRLWLHDLPFRPAPIHALEQTGVRPGDYLHL